MNEVDPKHLRTMKEQSTFSHFLRPAKTTYFAPKLDPTKFLHELKGLEFRITPNEIPEFVDIWVRLSDIIAPAYLRLEDADEFNVSIEKAGIMLFAPHKPDPRQFLTKSMDGLDIKVTPDPNDTSAVIIWMHPADAQTFAEREKQKYAANRKAQDEKTWKDYKFSMKIIIPACFVLPLLLGGLFAWYAKIAGWGLGLNAQPDKVFLITSSTVFGICLIVCLIMAINKGKIK